LDCKINNLGFPARQYTLAGSRNQRPVALPFTVPGIVAESVVCYGFGAEGRVFRRDVPSQNRYDVQPRAEIERPIAPSSHEIVEGGCRGFPSIQTSSNLLSVGVIVDLFQVFSAGGHVKSWEKLARAACGEPVDLTLYFFGSARRTESLAENVRYVHLPPAWSTASLPFLSNMPAHTDLAPLHLGALRRFRHHHVLHATDAYFSMARAAKLLSRWSSPGLVHSTHTETPGYTRVYTDQVVRRVCGDGWFSRMVRERWNVPARMERRMQRRLEGYLRACDWALAPDEGAARQLQRMVGSGRASVLRRGIDTDMFHPSRRDRERLERELGIAPDRMVLLFAGRIDSGKDVLTLARAAGILLDRGLPVHVICAGEGSQAEQVRELLGDRVSLPGQVSQDNLAWLYASADLFVFCSQIEVLPNVLLEAKASGLPAVASAHGGSKALMTGADGVAIASSDPAEWARAIEALLRDPERRRAMGVAAREFAEARWPSWRQVLREDLLPVWQFVARERGLLA
jgi:glycosyltransferase involved in cell wall biosynthesis